MKLCIITLLCLAAMVHTGLSLKCYACDSDKSPACLSKEDEKFVPEETMKKDCPGAESCITIALESVCTVGTSNTTQARTVRYCSFPDDLIREVELPKCPNGSRDTPRKRAKLCRKDLCNGPHHEEE